MACLPFRRFHFAVRMLAALAAMLLIPAAPAYGSGAEGPEEGQPLPSAFAAQFPGCQGLDKLWIPDEDCEAWLVRTQDGEKVLLCGTYRPENGWTIIRSTPLPPQAHAAFIDGFEVLDLGHAQCTVRRYHDDLWGVRYTGYFDMYAGPGWIGYYGTWNYQHYGEHPWDDLTEIDWMSLGNRLAEALPYLDASASATPDHPDTEGRTFLYERPDTNSSVTAGLLNGAPLTVLERNGEWTHVCLGRKDGPQQRPEGWIPTGQLAFAEQIHPEHFAMRNVLQFARNNDPVTLLTPDGSITVEDYDDKDFRVAGEKTAGGKEYWLVYSYYTEQAGYVLKEDLYGGNG